jgi:hypothetical protein
MAAAGLRPVGRPKIETAHNQASLIRIRSWRQGWLISRLTVGCEETIIENRERERERREEGINCSSIQIASRSSKQSLTPRAINITPRLSASLALSLSLSVSSSSSLSSLLSLLPLFYSPLLSSLHVLPPTLSLLPSLPPSRSPHILTTTYDTLRHPPIRLLRDSLNPRLSNDPPMSKSPSSVLSYPSVSARRSSCLSPFPFLFVSALTPHPPLRIPRDANPLERCHTP